MARNCLAKHVEDETLTAKVTSLNALYERGLPYTGFSKKKSSQEFSVVCHPSLSPKLSLVVKISENGQSIEVTYNHIVIKTFFDKLIK